MLKAISSFHARINPDWETELLIECYSLQK